MIRLGVFLIGMLALSATANLAFAQTPSPSPSAASTSTTPPPTTPTPPPTVTRTPTTVPTTVPGLTAPTNLSVDFFLPDPTGPVGPLIPRVSWSAVPGAVSYELELSATEPEASRDFKRISVVPALPTDGGFVRHVTERSFALLVCYRVRAVGAAGVVGPFSEAFCLPVPPHTRVRLPTPNAPFDFGPDRTPLPPDVGNAPAAQGDHRSAITLVAAALLALSFAVSAKAVRR